MKNKYPVCPQCGNEENFQIEKSPYGDTRCVECSYKASHEYFSVQKNAEDEGIIVGVMRFKPSGKYYDTMDIKLYNITTRLEEYELCWYVLIEQIRKFRNKCGGDLEFLIGYSDDSVKNYNKNDIYPILLKN